MSRQFGVLVQINVECVGVGINVFNFFGIWTLCPGDADEKNKQRKLEQVHGPGSYLPVPESANLHRKSICCNDFLDKTILISKQCNSPFPSFPPGVQSA